MGVTFKQNSHYMWFVFGIFHAKLFFLKAHISRSLPATTMARQMEQVSHYSQSRGQQKKNKVNTNVEWGKHETIHNTREKWMRPFLVFSLFSISLSLLRTCLIMYWPLLFFQLIGNKLKGMLPFNKSCFVWLGLTIITCVWQLCVCCVYVCVCVCGLCVVAMLCVWPQQQ